MQKKNKTPWPTKQAMQQVYAKQLWGSSGAEFFSGEGSHHPELVIPYIEVLKTFLTSFKQPLVVADLGCGDFNIGKQLVQHTKQYIGVDIVPELIAHNIKTFKADNLQFQCLDIAQDQLPKADCVIVRQVLQHLSNAEVQSVLNKLSNYKYIVLTEHVPQGDFVPNKDIISGQGIRLKKQSGLDIIQPPFNFKVKTTTELLTIELNQNKGIIKTTLYQSIATT
ncbi:class I SAM-dependent methyltransferase [Olleya aquimaris]|uniref:Methyltransferase family protein n=1 Tax=Olleya aquimaris TaxID=639310 RepID=A0A327RBG9_9FLAO|nr:class I SAM-dependent methyltransferase [Olleya aquimaris]RAJ13455.1 methyltransferase family protein [Olleya aquimaris]